MLMGLGISRRDNVEAQMNFLMVDQDMEEGVLGLCMGKGIIMRKLQVQGGRGERGVQVQVLSWIDSVHGCGSPLFGIIGSWTEMLESEAASLEGGVTNNFP